LLRPKPRNCTSATRSRPPWPSCSGRAARWQEFTAGLPLLEALNIGAVDLSVDVANAVPHFYLAATPYAQRRADVRGHMYAELQRAGDRVKRNPAEAAAWHAPLIGLDAATVEAANARRSYRVQPVDADALAEQQRIADAFTGAGVIPTKVVIAESGVWRPV
jgi:sulfonate transport system substrate-binding protein